MITEDGEEGEVVDATGDRNSVKLDNGNIKEFYSEDLQDNNSAG